jgi:endonuclease/exonuclease/phosphatase (EEP) superfamily protein YafD
MRKDYTDTMSGRRGFFGSTYSKNRAILPARVDYLFYRGDLVPLESRIVRETAGDHFPVITTFSYAG